MFKYVMVSAVIITYNRAAYLKDTIHSILKQTFDDIEVIIVDDGSTDETGNVITKINDIRLRYINPGKLGNLSMLRNIGIREAKGEYIAFCDDDDLWYPQRLSVQMDFIGDYPLICSNAKVIGPHGEFLSEKYFDDVRSDLIIDEEFLVSRGNYILTSTVLAAKKLFLEGEKMFDEIVHTNYCEDYELFLRQSVGNKFLFVDRPLVGKRIHPSVSTGKDNNIRMINQAINILESHVSERGKSSLTSKSIEGVLGYRLLLISKNFGLRLKAGLTESRRFLLYLLKPGVARVFWDRKIKRKLKKLVGKDAYDLSQ